MLEEENNMAKAKKIKHVPKIDLSRYNTVDILPNTVCDIVLSGLIAYDGSAPKVANHFKLDIEKVNEIYLMVYPTVQRALNAQDKMQEIDSAIYTGLDLMKNHLEEVKEKRDNSDTNFMSVSLTKNVNSIVDRLLKLKESDLSSYNNVINKMYESINRIKVAEHNNMTAETEPGANIAIDNQSEYIQKLTEYAKVKDITNGNRRRKVMGYNVATKETQEWESVTLCADYFHTDRKTISGKIKDKSTIEFKNGKGLWTFIYKEAN